MVLLSASPQVPQLEELTQEREAATDNPQLVRPRGHVRQLLNCDSRPWEGWTGGGCGQEPGVRLERQVRAEGWVKKATGSWPSQPLCRRRLGVAGGESLPRRQAPQLPTSPYGAVLGRLDMEQDAPKLSDLSGVTLKLTCPICKWDTRGEGGVSLGLQGAQSLRL